MGALRVLPRASVHYCAVVGSTGRVGRREKEGSRLVCPGAGFICLLLLLLLHCCCYGAGGGHSCTRNVKAEKPVNSGGPRD